MCRGQCSSDASIAVGYSHSGEGGSYAAEDLHDQVWFLMIESFIAFHAPSISKICYWVDMPLLRLDLKASEFAETSGACCTLSIENPILTSRSACNADQRRQQARCRCAWVRPADIPRRAG